MHLHSDHSRQEWSRQARRLGNRVQGSPCPWKNVAGCFEGGQPAAHAISIVNFIVVKTRIASRELRTPFFSGVARSIVVTMADSFRRFQAVKLYKCMSMLYAHVLCCNSTYEWLQIMRSVVSLFSGDVQTENTCIPVRDILHGTFLCSAPARHRVRTLQQRHTCHLF